MAWKAIEIDGRELTEIAMTPLVPWDTKSSAVEREWCRDGTRPDGSDWFLVGRAADGESLYSRIKESAPAAQ